MARFALGYVGPRLPVDGWRRSRRRGAASEAMHPSPCGIGEKLATIRRLQVASIGRRFAFPLTPRVTTTHPVMRPLPANRYSCPPCPSARPPLSFPGDLMPFREARGVVTRPRAPVRIVRSFTLPAGRCSTTAP